MSKNIYAEVTTIVNIEHCKLCCWNLFCFSICYSSSLTSVVVHFCAVCRTGDDSGWHQQGACCLQLGSEPDAAGHAGSLVESLHRLWGGAGGVWQCESTVWAAAHKNPACQGELMSGMLTRTQHIKVSWCFRCSQELRTSRWVDVLGAHKKPACQGELMFWVLTRTQHIKVSWCFRCSQEPSISRWVDVWDAHKNPACHGELRCGSGSLCFFQQQTSDSVLLLDVDHQVCVCPATNPCFISRCGSVGLFVQPQTSDSVLLLGVDHWVCVCPAINQCFYP